MALGTRLWCRDGAHADETQKNGDATLSESAKRRDRREWDSFFPEKLIAKLDTIQKRVDELSEVCMARNVCDKSAADATQLQAGTMRVPYWSDTVYFVAVPRKQLVEKVIEVP